MCFAGEVDRRFERRLGVAHSVVLLVAGRQALEDPHASLGEGSVMSMRWKAPRQGAVALEVAVLRYVVEPMQRSWPAARIGFSRFDASTVPPEAEPAPRMVWISSMKRIGSLVLLDLRRSAP